MRLLALHRALVLAAVLLVGGVVLPVAHTVEHGRHTAEARAALHSAQGHVHAAQGVDAFSVALPAAVQQDVVCVLCASGPISALLPAGTVVPAPHVFGTLDAPSALRARRGVLLRPIRGPPVLF